MPGMISKWFSPPLLRRPWSSTAGLLLAGFFGTAIVTGTWAMVVEAPEGTAHPTITLKQDGEKVTGSYQGRMGESTLDGTIKGNEIRFSVTLKFQDVSYVVIYTGTVSDDTMKGTARFGTAGTGNWSAKRKKNYQ